MTNRRMTGEPLSPLGLARRSGDVAFGNHTLTWVAGFMGYPLLSWASSGLQYAVAVALLLGLSLGSWQVAEARIRRLVTQAAYAGAYSGIERVMSIRLDRLLRKDRDDE